MAWLTKLIKEVVVYRSVGTDVFQNLALEEWLFKNVDFSVCRIMLLWRNKPCNPWMEANIERCREHKVSIARRQSGGGAVYHDFGNFNCTIFTSKNDYNRCRNLQLLCDTVNHAHSSHGNHVDSGRLYIGERYDVWCGQWKVSGSAAKLGTRTSYHHFTLLLDINTDIMHQVLQPHSKLQFSSSSATQSVRSSVINVCDIHPSLTYNTLCQDISNAFYSSHNIYKNTKILNVDPSSEDQFPGINEIRESLSADQWIFNKTPNFTALTMENNCTVHVHKGMVAKIDTPTTDTPTYDDSIGSSFNDYLLRISK